MNKEAINKFTALLQAGKLSRQALWKLKKAGIARSDEVLAEGLNKGSINLLQRLIERKGLKPLSRDPSSSFFVDNAKKDPRDMYRTVTMSLPYLTKHYKDIPTTFYPISTNPRIGDITLRLFYPSKTQYNSEGFNYLNTQTLGASLKRLKRIKDMLRALFLRHEVDENRLIGKDLYKVVLGPNSGHSSIDVLTNTYKDSVGFSDSVFNAIKKLYSTPHATIGDYPKSQWDLLKKALDRTRYKELR